MIERHLWYRMPKCEWHFPVSSLCAIPRDTPAVKFLATFPQEYFISSKYFKKDRCFLGMFSQKKVSISSVQHLYWFRIIILLSSSIYVVISQNTSVQDYKCLRNSSTFFRTTQSPIQCTRAALVQKTHAVLFNVRVLVPKWNMQHTIHFSSGRIVS